MSLIIIGVKPEEKQLIDRKDIPSNVIFIPNIFIPSLTDNRKYQIWRGSRFSAKSWTKAIHLLSKASNEEVYFRGIFARLSAKTARDSQFQLFKDLIGKSKYLTNQFTFEVSPMKVIHRKTGQYLQGASFEAPESIKGIPDATDCWIDEPIERSGSVTEAQFEDIDGTLRAPNDIPTQFHLTFNPIGKNNFIYKKMYDPQTMTYAQSNINDLKANWYDNPWCPASSKLFLENLKVSNPTRYEVDGNGNWGEPQNDAPYLSNYNDNLHYNNGQYAFDFGNHETLLSFDFNHTPTTATVYQKIPKVGIVAMRAYSQNGGTRKLCQLIKTDRGLMSVSKLNWTITGDSNGKNYTATGGDVNDYGIIKEEFGLPNSQIEGVYSRNHSLVYSRRLCDEFLGRVPFFIDYRADELRQDIMKAREDKHGNLYKDRKEGFGMDMFDNWRYAVHVFLKNGIEDIDYLINVLM